MELFPIGTYPSPDELVAVEKMLSDMRIQHWLQHDLFTIKWWWLLLFIVVPWIVWWKFVDRKKFMEILVYGLFVLIVVSYLDAVLTETIHWHYEVTLLPVWPRLITADFSVLPVTYMLIYQYFKNWKSFITASVIMAGLYAFAGEPFLHWAGIYMPLNWEHIYSFLIYIAIAILLRWLVRLVTAHSAHKA